MKSRSAFPAAPQGRFRRPRPRPTGPSDDTHKGASLTVSQIPNRTPSASSLFGGSPSPCGSDQPIRRSGSTPHSLGCKLERLSDVLSLKVRVGIENRGIGHAIGDHPDHGRNRDPKRTNARHAAHLVSIDGDTKIRHAALQKVRRKRTRRVHRARVPHVARTDRGDRPRL